MFFFLFTVCSPSEPTPFTEVCVIRHQMRCLVTYQMQLERDAELLHDISPFTKVNVTASAHVLGKSCFFVFRYLVSLLIFDFDIICAYVSISGTIRNINVFWWDDTRLVQQEPYYPTLSLFQAKEMSTIDFSYTIKLLPTENITAPGGCSKIR